MVPLAAPGARWCVDAHRYVAQERWDCTGIAPPQSAGTGVGTGAGTCARRATERAPDGQRNEFLTNAAQERRMVGRAPGCPVRRHSRAVFVHELEVPIAARGRFDPVTDHNALLGGICQKPAPEMPRKPDAEPARQPRNHRTAPNRNRWAPLRRRSGQSPCRGASARQRR